MKSIMNRSARMIKNNISIYVPGEMIRSWLGYSANESGFILVGMSEADRGAPDFWLLNTLRYMYTSNTTNVCLYHDITGKTGKTLLLTKLA